MSATPSKYLPIRVSSLRGDSKIKFNVYVQVAGKQILLCREGDSFEGERLERLRGKKLSRMFIPMEQQRAYEDYLAENLEKAFDDREHKPLDLRIQIAHGLLQVAAEDVMEAPENTTFHNALKQRAQQFIKFFISEPEVLTVFLNMKNVDYSVAHHAVNVAALSMAITLESQLMEARALQVQPMIMGALLHDIEHFYNMIDFTLPVGKLSTAEQTLHKKHAMAGYERLRVHTHFDPKTLVVVSEHEETIDGAGPRAKRERDLEYISMVVCAANVFDHYLLYDNLSPKDALKKMLIEKMGVIHLEAMRALQEALKKRSII